MAIRLLYFGATLALSLGLALYLTPIIRKSALRFGVLDQPDDGLKRHRQAVPYLGGVAVYLSFLVTLGVVFEFQPVLLGLLLAGTMMTMLGLFDDLKVLSVGPKVLGQLLAIWILIKSGVMIELVVIPGWMTIPLTVCWMLGLTNAFNIIDVSDGLSSGVGVIAGTALFVIAALNGDTLIAITTLALVGSLVGFLRYNQPPAQIYLGDTGALFIGFMLAALAMNGSYTAHSALGALVPPMILIVPILDTVLVTFARAAAGKSPACGSDDHFAVRLRHRGWSARRIAGYAYALGLLGAALGVGVTLASPGLAGALVATAGLMFLLNLWWLWRLAPPALLQPQIAETITELDKGMSSAEPAARSRVGS